VKMARKIFIYLFIIFIEMMCIFYLWFFNVKYMYNLHFN
jgi:hypothetical protein